MSCERGTFHRSSLGDSNIAHSRLRSGIEEMARELDEISPRGFFRGMEKYI